MAEDIVDIVDRLFDHARNVGGDDSFDRLGGSEACQAAAEITALRKERDELRGLIDEAVKELEPFDPQYDEADISEHLWRRMVAALGERTG